MNQRDAALMVVVAGLGAFAYGIYSGQNWAVNVVASVWPSAWMSLGNAPDYIPTLNEIEQQYGLPQNLLAAVAFQESSFNPSAVNGSSGATGMFQLLPQYYPNAGVNWQNDATTAASVLSGYFNQFGNWQDALAAYNWGPGNLQNSGATSLSQLPSETQGYVTNIVANVPVAGPFIATS